MIACSNLARVTWVFTPLQAWHPCQPPRPRSEISDGELYVGIPGAAWPAVAEHLLEIRDANRRMRVHYEAQRTRFQ